MTDKSMSDLLDEALMKKLAEPDKLTPSELEVVRKRVGDINKSSMKGSGGASDSLLAKAKEHVGPKPGPDMRIPPLESMEGRDAASA